jgi:hypothetical protein
MLVARRSVLTLPLLLAVPVLAVGCKSAGLKDVYTSRDSAGRLRTSVFQRDSTEIHLIIEFVSGRDDAVLLVDLYPPEGSISKFEETEIAPGKGDHKIDLKLVIEAAEGMQDDDGPWDVGKYEADIKIDGEINETVAFEVV